MGFHSGRELLEICAKEQSPISEIMRRRECKLGERSRDVVDHQQAPVRAIMRSAATPPRKNPVS